MDGQGHWDKVYTGRSPDQVSWYRPHLERSLALIESAQLPLDAAIIDVGGGTSTLVDDLLDRGHEHVTVLDISARAIENAQSRLGPRASQVTWLVGDITTIDLPIGGYDFWHDRAVFHFLREEAARTRYIESARRSLKLGGHIVVATFGLQGPDKCSGLEVMRYSAEQIHGHFGQPFEKLSSFVEMHQTPSGAEQEFVYCYCKRTE